jgi:hypothetical protein
MCVCMCVYVCVCVSMCVFWGGDRCEGCVRGSRGGKTHRRKEVVVSNTLYASIGLFWLYIRPLVDVY